MRISSLLSTAVLLGLVANASANEQRWVSAARFLPEAAPQLEVDVQWSRTGDYFWFVDRAGAQPLLKVWDAAARKVLHSVSLSALPPVDSAELTEAGHALLVRRGDKYTRCDLRSLKCTELKDVIAPSVGDIVSPDGRWSVFARDHNLWLRNLRTGETRALTTDGKDLNAYAKEADTASDAIVRVVRHDPSPPPVVARWSPDSRQVLVNKLDESSIPPAVITQFTPEDSVLPRFHTFRFPYAAADPRASELIYAIDIETGESRLITAEPLRVTAYSNLSWMLADWSSDSKKVFLIQCDEGEKHIALWQANPRTGERRKVIDESAAKPVQTRPALVQRPNVRLLKDGTVIWYSERDGWAHLYRYDAASGKLLNRITQGPWIARDILHVDETADRVYVLTGGLDAKADPYDTQVISVSLKGGALRNLTPEPGNHEVRAFSRLQFERDQQFGFSPSGRYFIETRSTVTQAPRTYLRSATSGQATLIAHSEQPPGQAKRVRLLASDGVTPLYGTLNFPSDFQRGRQYPIIDTIYAGPQTAVASPEYRAANFSRARALAEVGFITITLDARGTPFRSREFREFSYGERMNLVDILGDHVAAIRQLAQEWPEIDLDRVGIVGSSFGGYATARAMLSYPDFFRAGVSLAGSHDSRANLPYIAEVWQGRQPGQSYAEAAANMSVLTGAERLKGKLLIVAGDVDDNVSLPSVMRLVQQLIDKGKPFEFLLVPNQGHQVSGHPYVTRRVWEFFERTLEPGPR